MVYSSALFLEPIEPLLGTEARLPVSPQGIREIVHFKLTFFGIVFFAGGMPGSDEAIGEIATVKVTQGDKAMPQMGPRC